jgi:hypothetical protein
MVARVPALRTSIAYIKKTYVRQARLEEWRLNFNVRRTKMPPCNADAAVHSLFAWLISHQSTVLFSRNKPATSNQPAILFSQNKPAAAISHQPTEYAGSAADRDPLL